MNNHFSQLWPSQRRLRVHTVPLPTARRLNPRPVIKKDSNYIITEKIIADFVLKSGGVLLTRDIVNINTIQLDKCPKNTLVCLTGYSIQSNNILGTFFNKYFPKFTKPIILILIESDYYTLYKSWIEHPMITHIYGWNIPVNHEKVSALPIGLNYYRQGIIMQQILPRYTPPEQTYLLGINFSANTNPMRSKLVTYSKTKWKDFCTPIKPFPNIQEYTRRSHTDGTIRIVVTNPAYYNEISKFKFVLSPPGAGVDCHRTWELLYLGCIPIVEHSSISELYEDLPILVVDNWDDISKELLEKKYTVIKEKVARGEYNMDKLSAQYWVKIIKDKAIN